MTKPTKAALDAATLLLNKAIEGNLIAKSGKDYVFGAETLGSSKDKAATYLAENGGVADAIKAKLAAKPDEDSPAGAETGQIAQKDVAAADEPGLQESAISSPATADSAVTLSLPLPANVPAEALKDASIVVKAKAHRGRWRAGRFFSRDETLIGYAELSEAELAALAGDPELVVGVRLGAPG